MERNEGPHRILWADDDRDDLELFQQILQEEEKPYEVLIFENGQELLAYLQAIDAASYPCLIILDMNMPVLSGRDTLIRLKAQPEWKDLSIVIFTTSNSSIDQRFCAHYGTEMVTKPPSYKALKAIIPRLLSNCSHP